MTENEHQEDEHRKELAIKIADTIQEILHDSDELSNLLQQARQDGYAVFLSIFSGVVVRRKHSEEAESASFHEEESEPLPEIFEFTEEDRAFLKSIGIQATE
jgi:F0F1-type ATP synthase assembly protein I